MNLKSSNCCGLSLQFQCYSIACMQCVSNNEYAWAVVVAQLGEQLLLMPEVHSSNPVIEKNYNEHLFIVNCVEKSKIIKRGRKLLI